MSESEGLAHSAAPGQCLGTCAAPGWTSPQEARPWGPANEHRPRDLPWSSFLSMGMEPWREGSVREGLWCNSPFVSQVDRQGHLLETEGERSGSGSWVEGIYMDG